MTGVVLSLFPGIDLLGRGFDAEGYCVVRGPDLLWGQSIADWHANHGLCEGIIAGSPCQDYSRGRRCPPSGEGDTSMREFARVVTEAGPDWFLLENVPGVPAVAVEGYEVQRLNLDARECGGRQRRLRCFQFGRRDGPGLVITRHVTPGRMERTCMASEANRPARRTWADFCELQGLPRDFDLPGWSLSAKYKAVGNGVPVYMARVVAAAIRRRRATGLLRVCVCGCGRPVTANAIHGAAACRKRMERRRRDTAGVTPPGPDAIETTRPATP